ncbi:MAG: glycoside hydrolase family 3 N-terminal domain-containing protein [Oscillospiraceae bacterium]|nr:glycoside hydrolase family 3 N-terminal domain-containing protein [Oscillospiraceae bacterium]
MPLTGDRGLKLSDVKDKKCTLDEFTAQLSLTELEAISRGDYIMNSPLGAEGNAGVFGGVLQSLRDKGVKPIVTTDGPSGIRLKASCSLLPIGSLLSSTWNEALLSEVYKKVGEEMKDRGSDVLLAPGMNIHRNPLCGRNFEYFSEDPLLSGKSAAAVVRGLQSAAVSACPKHFACNNQETNRTKNDSRVSERALREIYLKNFEICIKESSPLNIMTSYNKVNGVWSHYNYDLCTQILRNEWHYEGNVITDWWMQKSKSPEFPEMRDNAYRVRAQVDVLMPGGERVGKRKPDGTLLKTYNKPDGITLGELQRTAKNVLKTVLALKY